MIRTFRPKAYKNLDAGGYDMMEVLASGRDRRHEAPRQAPSPHIPTRAIVKPSKPTAALACSSLCEALTALSTVSPLTSSWSWERRDWPGTRSEAAARPATKDVQSRYGCLARAGESA